MQLGREIQRGECNKHFIKSTQAMQHNLKKSEQVLHRNGRSQNMEQTPRGTYKLVNMGAYRNYLFCEVSWDFSKVFLFKNLNCFNGTGITKVIQFLMWKSFWRCIHRYKGGHSSISFERER